MRQVSLWEFRTRGAKALKAVPRGETVLLAGQRGPAYFLVPVMGDVTAQEWELRGAMAKASLRQSWRLAEKYPVTDEEIEKEIAAARTERQARRGMTEVAPTEYLEWLEGRRCRDSVDCVFGAGRFAAFAVEDTQEGFVVGAVSALGEEVLGLHCGDLFRCCNY